MSYLSSLLGKAETGGQSSTVSSVPKLASTQTAERRHLTAPSASAPSAGTKRKVADMLPNETVPVTKVPRASDAKAIQSSRPAGARPSPMITERQRPAAVKGSGVPNNGETAPRGAAPSPSAATAPPPKGSFAEIMARAKALQATKLGQGPKFTHKPISQTKDDLRDKRKKEESVQAPGKRTNAKQSTASSKAGGTLKQSAMSSKVKSNKAQIAEKPKRKAVEVEYKGTMRPVPGQLQRQSTATSQASVGRTSYGGHGQRRRTYDQESEDEDEEEEDYNSDASSDMEAGAWDIDEEEEAALMKAKLEDAAAKREEEEHRRRKLLRKQEFESAAARRRP